MRFNFDVGTNGLKRKIQQLIDENFEKNQQNAIKLASERHNQSPQSKNVTGWERVREHNS